MKLKSNSLFFSLAPLVCSIMVVGIHSYNAGKLDSMSTVARIEGFFSHGLFTAAVPVFFAMSGFLFFRNIKSQADVRVKQKRRTVSLGIPFLAWSGLYYAIYALLSCLPGYAATNVDISLRGLLSGVLFYEYVFPMWFMFQLIIYVLLTPLLFECLKNNRNSLCLLLAMAVCGLLGVEINIHIGELDRALFMPNMFCYFFIGCICSRNERVFNKALEKANQIPVCVLVGGVIPLALLESLLFDGIIPSFNKRVGVPFVAITVFLVLFKASKAMENRESRRFEQFLFSIPTLVIYGIHPLIGIITGRVLSSITLHEIVAYLIAFLIITLGSGIFAIIVTRIRILNYLFNGNR